MVLKASLNRLGINNVRDDYKSTTIATSVLELTICPGFLDISLVCNNIIVSFTERYVSSTIQTTFSTILQYHFPCPNNNKLDTDIYASTGTGKNLIRHLKTLVNINKVRTQSLR
jgi:hypothetical protein